MPRATADHTTPPDPLQATVDRLKAIAGASAAAVLTEGPVQPDWRLLDLCAEALSALARSEAIEEHRLTLRVGRQWDDAARALGDLLLAEKHALDVAARTLMRAIGKLRATTPAGIFAKATVVRTSKSAATVLALSMAEDLTGSAALRASLWPAWARA